MKHWLPAALALATLFTSATRMAAAGTPAPGETFTVDSAVDAVDANPGDRRCATAEQTCTLRAAVQEADASD